MNVKLFTRCRIVFSLFIALLFILPSDFVLASPNNQRVDECLQNPDACEDSQPAVDEQESTAVGLGLWDYVRMLFSLILVLGILIFVLKFLNKKSSNYQQNNLVRNIGGISVGSQKSVQLLHIGDTLYIVGVGENVQLIKEITDPKEVENLLEYYNDKQSFVATTPYILELVNKLKPNKDNKEVETDNRNSNFGDMLTKRITDIKTERQTELEKWKEKEREKDK